MKILFTIGYQNKPFNHTEWEKNGAGGSEYCVLSLAEQFAKNNHEVYVTGELVNETWNGITFVDYNTLLNNQHFDVVIASNYIHYFKHLEDKNITFDKSYFWIHNLEFYPWYNGTTIHNNGLDYLNHPKLTNIIAVSEWQKEKLVEKYNLKPEKVKVIGNAINPQLFDSIEQEKFKHKVIYTSGPDRGLWDLLYIWPDLKKLNPKLTLWIANPPYTDGWDELDRVKQDFPDYDKKYDVRYLGSLNPTDLVRQIKSSEYWLYPSKYPETYCITALEMMMGRVKIISTDTGNLKRLLSNKSVLIQSDKEIYTIRETFIAAFAFNNHRNNEFEKNLNIAEEYARDRNWENRYTEWKNLIKLINQPMNKFTKRNIDLQPPSIEKESGRLHDDLYSYWDDKEQWTNKFITYSARTKEWDLIVDEPFDSCFTFPLFTEEFCKKIREEAEHSNAWTVDRHENYPTTDMLLTAIGMDEIYNDVMKEYVMQLSIYLWALEGKGWDNMNSENFLAKYKPNAQGHLSIHHDRADITCLIQLSDLDEYEGGGTWFRRQKKLVKSPIGYATLHPGNITHKHGARATTKGTRYIVVSFMENRES